VDAELVRRGLARSRQQAAELIGAGRVSIDGMPAAKPATSIPANANLRVIELGEHSWVSRGAHKLIGAIDTFGLTVDDRRCLDAGASTGGFTEVLLQRGAARVYAIDVGYGQLAWSIRRDPRVVVLERHNVRSLEPALVPEPCDLAVIDVSFISLALVLPRVRELLGPPAGKPIVALVKPQFEVGRELVGKGGVVRDPAARRACVDKVRAWAGANGFVAGADVESPITGPAGNVEYLLLLHTAPPG
jgi:23S rRNA (cytidine1920-2'-O)/16S rRNA (cytidine1409-2'-O)-methyltransferase